MIPAIRNGKLKVKLKEDSLTSSIFQLLTYLPNNLLSNIFQSTIGNKLNEKNIGNLKSIEFWTKWSALGTSNKNFVEPDILLSFENIDIIVEAKRHDLKGQYRRQWKNEFLGYLNEYPNTEKKVALWALGGNENLKDDVVSIDLSQDENEEIPITKKYQVVKTTWIRLVTAIKSEYLEYRTLIKEAKSNGIERIFLDLIYSFEIHGFFVGTWIEEIGFEPISLRNGSIAYFQQNSEKYDSSKWLYSLKPININFNLTKTLQKWKIQTKN